MALDMTCRNVFISLASVREMNPTNIINDLVRFVRTPCDFNLGDEITAIRHCIFALSNLMVHLKENMADHAVVS